MIKQSILAVLLVAPLAPGAVAALRKPAPIEVEQAWIRQAPPDADVLAAYMVIDNHSDRAVRLVEATTPVAGEVQFHAMQRVNGMMQMNRLAQVRIPAHGSFVFRPGADHLMLLHPRKALLAGMRVPVILTFQRAGMLHLEIPVKRLE